MHFQGVKRDFFFIIRFFFERTRPAASTRPACFIYLSTSNEAKTREPSDRGRLLPIGRKACSHRGAYRVPLLNWPVTLSVCLCVRVTFVVFTDCESCTGPIPISPGSMQAGEYKLTRGTCFVFHHLEVVAVAGLLWIL